MIVIVFEIVFNEVWDGFIFLFFLFFIFVILDHIEFEFFRKNDFFILLCLK